MAFPTGWSRYCAVVIDADQVSGTSHSDFPVLITEDMLPSEMFDADGSYPALNGGGDIRFTTDTAGSNGLHCEVVAFVTDNNPANGSAEIWVKVPTLSGSGDTTIYVWYNATGETQPAASDATFGSQGVWSDYIAVYHGNDTADSTANGYTLTGVNTPVTGSSVGAFGASESFLLDDSSSEMFYSASTSLDSTAAFSMQGWFYSDNDNNQGQNIVGLSSASGTTGANRWARLTWQANVASNPIRVQYEAEDSLFVDTTAGKAASTWGLAHATFNASGHPVAYLDGGNSATASTVPPDEPMPYINIGAWKAVGGPNQYFSGYIDEVRVRNSQLSAEWIATEYANQGSPATFAVAGTPVSVGGGGVSVAPGQANLALSTTAPAVQAGTSADVQPSAANLALTATAPSVTASDNVALTPASADLSLSATAPDVASDESVNRTVPSTDLALTTQSPAVVATDNRSIEVPVINLSLNSIAPEVTQGFTITPPGAALVLSSVAPTLVATDNKAITVDKADLALSTAAPTAGVAGPIAVSPAAANLTLIGYAPTSSDSGSLWTEIVAVSTTWTEI